jgi:hypothetical protein
MALAMLLEPQQQFARSWGNSGVVVLAAPFPRFLAHLLMACCTLAAAGSCLEKCRAVYLEQAAPLPADFRRWVFPLCVRQSIPALTLLLIFIAVTKLSRLYLTHYGYHAQYYATKTGIAQSGFLSLVAFVPPLLIAITLLVLQPERKWIAWTYLVYPYSLLFIPPVYSAIFLPVVRGSSLNVLPNYVGLLWIIGLFVLPLLIWVVRQGYYLVAGGTLAVMGAAFISGVSISITDSFHSGASLIAQCASIAEQFGATTFIGSFILLIACGEANELSESTLPWFPLLISLPAVALVYLILYYLALAPRKTYLQALP